MKVIEVSASKGGVGTSTVAVSLAVALSNATSQSTVLLDTSVNADTWAIAGLPAPSESTGSTTLGEHELVFRKTTASGIDELFGLFARELTVVDAGLNPRSEYGGIEPFRVSVVNNSYLSLRAETFPRTNKPDAVLCLFNGNYALTKSDVSNVIGSSSTVHFFDISDAVARSIDAGLYATHRSHLFSEWTNEFLQHYGFIGSTSALPI